MLLVHIFGSRWMRGVGAFCILLIVILSLIPGAWQERTPLPGPLEHFIAYAGTAAILVFAAFGVLVAVRLMHWGRVLDVRSMGG